MKKDVVSANVRTMFPWYTNYISFYFNICFFSQVILFYWWAPCFYVSGFEMLHRPTMKPDSFLGLCTTLCLWRVLSPCWGKKSELPLFEFSNTFLLYSHWVHLTLFIARSLVRSLETSNMFMRMWGWVSSLCFRILTLNNTNPDILFATEFILIQMTASVTVLLLFIPKASFFLIHRTWRNLKYEHWPILTLGDFFRVHIDSYKRKEV